MATGTSCPGGQKFRLIVPVFHSTLLVGCVCKYSIDVIIQVKKIELFYLLLDDPIGNKQHALLGPAVHANIGAVFVKSRVRFDQIFKIGLI